MSFKSLFKKYNDFCLVIYNVNKIEPHNPHVLLFMVTLESLLLIVGRSLFN